MNNVALRYDPWPGSDSTARFARAEAEEMPIARPEVSTPASNLEAPWMKITRARIYELARLREDNWDGRGSAAVRTDVLAFLWAILGQVMPYNGEAPGIIPLGHGGVQIEWRAHGRELELEIARPNEIEGALFNTQNGAEREIHADAEHLDSLTSVIWQNIPRN